MRTQVESSAPVLCEAESGSCTAWPAESGEQAAGEDVLRAFIYVRISKDRIGAGLGVERQEGECRVLAENLSRSLDARVTVIEVFVDDDMSAYSGKPRKRYIEMAGCRRGSPAR